MDADILCTLLAQRIDPAYFQLWGLDIHWTSPDYDTTENRAIVADVITNYDTLAAVYEAEQEALLSATDVKAVLADIDLKSIRALRERQVAIIDALPGLDNVTGLAELKAWLLSAFSACTWVQDGTTKTIKTRNENAQVEREKL